MYALHSNGLRSIALKGTIWYKYLLWASEIELLTRIKITSSKPSIKALKALLSGKSRVRISHEMNFLSAFAGELKNQTTKQNQNF